MNRACQFIKIHGTPDAEGECFAGMAAQMSYMNLTTENIASAGQEEDAPEFAEAEKMTAQAEFEDDSVDAMNEVDADLPPIADTPGEERSLEIELAKGLNVETLETADAQGRGARPLPLIPLVVAAGSTLLPYLPRIAGALRTAVPAMARGSMAFLRNWRSWWPAVKGAVRNPRALWQAIKTFKFGSILSGAQTAGNLASQFAQTYQMVLQFQTLNEYARMLSPEVGGIIDDLKTTEEVLKSTTAAATPPADEGSRPRGASTGIGVSTTLNKVAVPRMDFSANAFNNANSYTVNSALRYLTGKQLPKFEAIFLELLKKLEARVEFKDSAPKEYNIAQILYNSLNYEKPGLLGRPAEDWSLAKILAQGIPVIEHTNASGKKVAISVLELIMQAQDSKVVELGPGFLKWYTEADVVQHNIYANARAGATSEPVSGT